MFVKNIKQFLECDLHSFKKTIRITRIALFLMFVTVLQAFASDSYSDKTKLSLDFKEVKLLNVLDEIETKSEFFFIYNQKLIDTERKVSLSVKNKKIDEILNELFSGTNVIYTIIDRKIILAPAFLSSNQQEKTITGKVTDDKGEALSGITVAVKGTNQGNITDFDGKYSISNVPENATLVFSFIGMKTQEVVISKQTVVDVTMAYENFELDEVVVIGYATQKKVTLTGAVDVVSGEELQNRPSGSVSQLLQGVSPSLNISATKNGGDPSGGGPTWNIRGIGTLSGSSAPLVLVDGVAMSMNSVNPNTIESVTVLKDAAASAIYGSRAPFGVVLITTKKGSKDSEFSLSYNSFVGFASPIGVAHMESSVKLATAFNQVNANDGIGPKFPAEQIAGMQAYIDGSGPAYDLDNPFSSMWSGRHVGYANHDWNQKYWKQNSFRQKHDISMSGGSSKTQYYISAEFYDQDGLFNYGTDELDRYSVLANVTSQVNDWMSINFSSRFAQTSYDRPVGPFGNDTWSRYFMLQTMQTFWPMMPMYNDGVDKNDRILSINNPIIRLLEGDGRNVTTNNDSWITLGTELEPVKGWKTKLSYSYNYFLSRNETTLLPIPVHLPDGSVNNIGSGIPKYSTYTTSGDYKIFNAITSYDKNINDHYFNGLLGYESESYFDANLSGSVTNLITPFVPSINTGTGTKVLGESKQHWGTEAFFGRLQYNYKEKYLFEVNGRYSGSSRFAPDNRWGLFPSISAGYNISKEEFWSPISNIVNDLKIRGSYGSLGNQNVPNYLYLSTVPTGANLNYIIGDERPIWADTPAIVSSNLTWEKITTLNVGFDMSLLNNRLDVTFDWFNRVTDDMFGPAEIVPSILGTSPPLENNAKMETTGWETSISWRDVIGSDLSYNLKLMIGDAKSTILEYKNENGLIDGFYNGKELGEIWGYTTDGIIQTVGETMPDQSVFFNTWGPGDIKYKDLDGDNIIGFGDRTLDNHEDLSRIGNTTPRYSIAFNGGLTWKGIDFNMFWQGVAKQTFFPEYGWSASNFWGIAGGTNNSTIFKEGHLDYWRPGNETNILGPNTGAYYPKPYFSDENFKSRQIQTKYLLDAAYLRLKNVQIGYTIPTEMTQKIQIQKLRLYFSGENLLTFTKLTDLLDPETSVPSTGFNGNRGIGRVYPLSRVISFGLNLTF